MFSPVSGSRSANSIPADNFEGRSSTAPFDLTWLSEKFGFDCSDVKKAEFDSMGLMFKIYFKSGKESVAQQFCDNLTSKGCHPQYFKFNNSVCLNKYQREKILSAGSSELATSSSQPLISRERSNPLDSIAIRNQILSTPKFDVTFSTTSSEKKPRIPFDLSWLHENYKLDPIHIKKASFSSIPGCGFEIEFKPEAHLARSAFIAVLNEIGCKYMYSSFGNSVEIKETQQEQLIGGTAAGQNFIPPIENEAAIDGALKKGILLAKFFLGVLPSVQSMKRFYEQDQDSPWVQACGANYREDNAKIEHFLREITPHIPLIKEILSDPEYKNKLEYYFITEKDLISKLERFVKTQNGSFHQALLDINNNPKPPISIETYSNQIKKTSLHNSSLFYNYANYDLQMALNDIKETAEKILLGVHSIEIKNMDNKVLKELRDVSLCLKTIYANAQNALDKPGRPHDQYGYTDYSKAVESAKTIKEISTKLLLHYFSKEILFLQGWNFDPSSSLQSLPPELITHILSFNLHNTLNAK